MTFGPLFPINTNIWTEIHWNIVYQLKTVYKIVVPDYQYIFILIYKLEKKLKSHRKREDRQKLITNVKIMKKKCFYFYFYFTQLNGSNHVMYLFLQRESLFYYQLTNSLHKIIVSSNIEQKMNSVIILACVNLSNYATH